MKTPIRKLKPSRILLRKQLEKIKFEANGIPPGALKYLTQLVNKEVTKETVILAGRINRLHKKSGERLVNKLDAIVTLAAVNEAITYLIDHTANSQGQKDAKVDPTELKAAVADLESNVQTEINLSPSNE